MYKLSWKDKDGSFTEWKLYLQQEPFRIFREQYPERLKKLIVIPGDVTVEELALSIADKERLTNRVSVVFHMAANIRFDLSLKAAIKMNTMSTINVVTLAKQVRISVISGIENDAKLSIIYRLYID